MLLQSELQFVESQMIELSKKHDLQSYVNELKKSGSYKDFLTRLSWDLIRAACGCNYLFSLYAKYGANDTHITTLAKKLLRCLSWNFKPYFALSFKKQYNYPPDKRKLLKTKI